MATSGLRKPVRVAPALFLLMSILFQAEKLIKDPLFGCQHCGQCILSHTALICPMNCPKGLRNGPCGGTLDGKCEVIPERVMREIYKRTGLATISLGSGRYADVMFLFMSDICGESDRIPRHARAYGDLASLHAQVRDARVEALTAYRADVLAGQYPGDAEVAGIDDAEFDDFVERL